MEPKRGIVRPARRPVGWCPPGPPPAGPGAHDDLWPRAGEDLCYLLGDWRIFQRLDGHRWSLDDLVTAAVAADEAKRCAAARVLDLGCGIGSVLMMVAWHLPEARGLGVEAQPLSCDLARRSLAYNGIASRVEVRCADLRDPGVLADEAPFDLVTGTPPYLDLGAGVVSGRPQRGPCCFEIRGGIEAYCGAAARALAAGGRFVACEAARQEARVAAAARAAGLDVLARLDVVPRQGKQALFAVYTFARSDDDAGASARADTLVVRDAAGARTPAFVALRAVMGMPP
jgi:tRNA1(Val) A37 N6-methylase TrmN6